MDPLESFTFLTDNLPSWMVSVDRLNSYTAEKQTEFAAEFSKLVRSKPSRSRRSSTKSIRDKEDEAAVNSTPKAATDLDPPQYTPLDLANKYVFATARRKRKDPTSSARSGASGPQKYRNKHMVVVWYDAGVQEGFESLVRNIASARNNLRKGKMSSVMMDGFQLPGIRSSTVSYGIDTINGLRSKVLMPTVKPTAMRKSPGTSAETAFDRADKELETAQSLCEVAAHQFLRDGDCELELRSIKQRFEETLKICTLEHERLQEEKKAAEAQKEQKQQDDAMNEKTCHENGVNNAASAKVVQLAVSNSNMIEVDDDSDSDSIDIDISAFRAARMGNRIRT